MEWLQLISGVGIGAIAVKLLDVFWLQKVLQQHQKATWLREKRLEAFADVTKELISFGLHKKDLRNPFEIYGAIAPALLLIEDNNLVNRIDYFFVELDRMNGLSDSGQKKEAEKLYEYLVGEAREISQVMRAFVLHD